MKYSVLLMLFLSCSGISQMKCGSTSCMCFPCSSKKNIIKRPATSGRMLEAAILAIIVTKGLEYLFRKSPKKDLKTDSKIF